MSVIVLLLILLLSVIGLCDIIHSIKLALLKVKNGKNKLMFCVLKDESSELSLRYVIEQHKWSGKQFADKIVVVNCLNNTSAIERCKVLSEYYDFDFIEKDDILSYFTLES